MTVLYETEAMATGGREGRVTTPDAYLDVDLVVPKELGGPGGIGTNPEQLFAAGYASCFHNAVRMVARAEKLDHQGSSVTAHVALTMNDAGGFGLAVRLDVAFPGADHADVERVVAKAHEVCPYSNATRGNVDVELNLVDAPAPHYELPGAVP